VPKAQLDVGQVRNWETGKWEAEMSRTKSEQFKLKTLALKRGACNLNKPEKQTQRSDTVKEELPVCETTAPSSSDPQIQNSTFSGI